MVDRGNAGATRWWIGALVAVLVLLSGVAFFLLPGLVGGDDTSTNASRSEEVGASASAESDDPYIDQNSLIGRWVLETWEENGSQVTVAVGVNAAAMPWLEFRQTFAGQRESFASAYGAGEAGTFTGSTGCNDVNPVAYEFSAGFLVIEEATVSAGGCDPGVAEDVLLAMLWRTPDGMEVIMRGDRMEWYGSNVEGRTFPLTFRRDGPVSAAPDPSTTVAPETSTEELRLLVEDVDGVEVVSASWVEELPDRARVVDFSTTVIDSGSGPELCLGGVANSLPPQCSGPVAVGLNLDGWSEEANGVRWGERKVTVVWPPVDGRVEAVYDSGPEPFPFDFPYGAIPDECAEVPTEAGSGAISDYARSLGEANGGLYLSNEGVVVLQVVGDPQPHRTALAADGGACVVEVPRSEAEQRRIQNAITPLLADILGPVGYSTSTGPGGRVDIGVPVADRATAMAIAELVNDPTAIRLVGFGVILE